MLNAFKRFIIKKAPDNVLFTLINVSNRLKGRPGRIGLYEEGIYIVDDGEKVAYSPRRRRLRRYYLGVDKQCEELSREYLLYEVSFNKGDVVVDCGANNGEIGIWACSKGLEYFAFEPEPLEARCCDLNNYGGEAGTIRKGLWFEQTTLKWYSKPDSADSSIIEMSGEGDVTSIETMTLEDFVDEEGLESIRLFKLEAEGAEPEVLQGALGVLNKIDYIAVDCGYERGIDKKHTFMEIYKTLTEHDFEIIAAEFKRVVFLFKRRDVQ